jgi:transcriptional regulator with XRE-family HTH domain
MTEITDKYWVAATDSTLMENIGSFIKYHRLLQNKTQKQVAEEAGIARSTLSMFERGQNTSMIIFIQLLRVLKLLNLLQEFQVKQQISPIQLARMDHTKRIRARRKGRNVPKPESDW